MITIVIFPSIYMTVHHVIQSDLTLHNHVLKHINKQFLQFIRKYYSNLLGMCKLVHRIVITFRNRLIQNIIIQCKPFCHHIIGYPLNQLMLKQLIDLFRTSLHTQTNYSI